MNPAEYDRLKHERFEEVYSELAMACAKFPAFNSAHEGLAVILEEFEELKAEVFKRQGKRDVGAMRGEAIQMAAMAIRFSLDVCDVQGGQK